MSIADDLPFSDTTDESAGRKMPGHDRLHRKAGPMTLGLALYPKMSAPEGAPLKIADIKVAHRCICKSLPDWARPCGECARSKR